MFVFCGERRLWGKEPRDCLAGGPNWATSAFSCVSDIISGAWPQFIFLVMWLMQLMLADVWRIMLGVRKKILLLTIGRAFLPPPDYGS